MPSDLAASNTAVSAFLQSSPRHLDPVASYWSNDTPYTYQIYEPPYGYHYLLRPFKLMPKTATDVVTPTYLDKDGKALPADAPGDQVAESVYDIRIKPGILYQPHPAFAQDEQGRWRYHAMKPGDLGSRRSPLDFEHSGTRELVAEDYVYALKRHATPRITTPIFGIFSEYVLGLKDYAELIKDEDAKLTRRARPGQPGQALPGLPSLAAGRCQRTRQAPAAHPRQGQVPAVGLLDDDDLPGAGALGGRGLLCPAGHGGSRPEPGHLAGRHRPVHDDRVRQGPAPCAEAQPQLPRRALPLRRHAGRQGVRPARRLRQDHAVHRQLRLDHGARGRAAARQVPPGLLRHRGLRKHQLGPGLPGRDAGFRRGARRVPGQGLAAAALCRRDQLVPRLQHARPGDRLGRHARAARAQPQAAPGDLDRHRLGRALQGVPQVGRRDRDEPAAARRLRLAPRHARRHQPGDAQAGRRQGRAPRHRRGQAAAGRSRLPERPRRQDRQAAGHQLRLLLGAHARHQGGDRLDGAPVRQDRHPARRARHRQQPVPGQGAQGQLPGVLAGLAGRLPRCRELPVPAVRPERQDAARRREHRQLRQPRIRPAVRAVEAARRRAAEAGADRPHGGHHAAGCADELRLLSVFVGGGAVLGAQLPAGGADP